MYRHQAYRACVEGTMTRVPQCLICRMDCDLLVVLCRCCRIRRGLYPPPQHWGVLVSSLSYQYFTKTPISECSEIPAGSDSGHERTTISHPEKEHPGMTSSTAPPFRISWCWSFSFSKRLGYEFPRSEVPCSAPELNTTARQIVVQSNCTPISPRSDDT